MKQYIIGIDTGGTYTDAVVLRRNGGVVIAVAKSPTTHHNLSIGISTCLKKVFEDSKIKPDEVEAVAVSTTLATNTVVEGKGADVGLLVAGPAKPFKLPVVSVSYLKGGHNHLGEEIDPLDMEMLVDAIESFKGNVDAYVACASMSVVNPAHEKIIQKAVSLIDPKPVFCSYEVSDRTGVKERAATAVLNARLMPVMNDFLLGMQDSLVSLGLAGNVLIIRGDATPMDISKTHKKAASTVASGPAATAWYGLSFSPKPDALIVDVGGTTTDITVIREGRPLLDEAGSLIGEWHTHVDAVQMSTVGAGGDSHAVVGKNGELVVGPGRVLPLCMSPNTPPPGQWLGRGLNSKCVMAEPDLSPDEAKHDQVLSFLLEHGPATPEVLKNHFDMAEITLLSHLRELGHLQLIVETGFTPTDALHVLNKLDLGSRGAALEGAEKLAEECGVSTEELSRLVMLEVEKKIEDAILDHILKIETGKTMTGFFPGYRRSSLLDLRFIAKFPIVGIGAAARYLLPGVAKRLQTEVVFADHYEVGNALGAALMVSPDNQVA
ncbi:MAG: hydantoinase/oxoprolinase family protein [Desulfobulbaceae bacterium]|nr:hydantoinase/oxoprolinase family protein [Desulfobulbaceae bacterium]